MLLAHMHASGFLLRKGVGSARPGQITDPINKKGLYVNIANAVNIIRLLNRSNLYLLRLCGLSKLTFVGFRLCVGFGPSTANSLPAPTTELTNHRILEHYSRGMKYNVFNIQATIYPLNIIITHYEYCSYSTI